MTPRSSELSAPSPYLPYLLLKALGAVVIILSLTGCCGHSVGSDSDIERFDLWVSCYLSEESGIGSVRLIGRRTTGFMSVDDVQLTRAEINRVLEGFVRTEHFGREKQASEACRFPGCSIYAIKAIKGTEHLIHLCLLLCWSSLIHSWPRVTSDKRAPMN